MADDKNGSKVAIIVAIIGLIGVIGGAVISNWDKLVSSSHSPGRRHPVRRMGQLLLKTNLQGNDLSPVPILVARPEDCSDQCEKRDDCVAMTFVWHNDPTTGGDCWLKNKVSPKLPNPVMASAIKENRLGGR